MKPQIGDLVYIYVDAFVHSFLSLFNVNDFLLCLPFRGSCRRHTRIDHYKANQNPEPRYKGHDSSQGKANHAGLGTSQEVGPASQAVFLVSLPA